MNDSNTPRVSHTPGPWVVEMGGEYRIRGANDQTVFLIGDDRRLIPTGADAALIAAAPELLAALEAAVLHLEGVHYAQTTGTKVPFVPQTEIDRMSSATAKAKGGAA